MSSRGACPTGTLGGERRPARADAPASSRSPSFIIGAAVIVFWIVCAIFGDHITPYDPRSTRRRRSAPPSSAQYSFGTDRLGRDVFSRVLAGSRDMLIIAPLATLLAIVVGTALGLITGTSGGSPTTRSAASSTPSSRSR